MEEHQLLQVQKQSNQTSHMYLESMALYLYGLLLRWLLITLLCCNISILQIAHKPSAQEDLLSIILRPKMPETDLEAGSRIALQIILERKIQNTTVGSLWVQTE